MSKIVLNDVTNLNTLSVINDNFDKIEQELQNKVMYRDNPEGEPNTLESDVDANGNSLYNVNNLTIQGSFTVDGQDVGTYISQAQEAADEAAQSATAAANSSASAASSASSASSSASTATAQATIATTKANEASSSASSAASSAATATTQAGVATTQAGIATTQANTATTQAANSAASATAAASSATSSANSATASATSATNSANSATASAASASASAASAAAAALALDNFDDRYLGVKSTAPTLDNDGNALIAGALYFNDGTVVGDDKGMWAYDGAAWIKASAASQAILVTYEYVATAGQTTFSGNDANGVSLQYTAGSIIVCLNGVKLRPGNDYTASNGTSVVLVSGAAAGDDLTVDAFSTFDIASVYTQAQVDALLAGKVNKSGDTMTGQLVIGGQGGLYPSQLVIQPSTHATSRRATLQLDTWYPMQDTGGSGVKDFGIYNTALGGLPIKIDTAGRVTMPYQPAFQTYRTTATGTGTIVFDGTVVNNGGYYSTSNGRFTAPVAGNYFFSFGWLPNSVAGATWYLQKNGGTISGSAAYNQSADQHTSVQVIVNLNVGDYVTVYASSGDGSEAIHCHFNGHIIG